MIIFHEGLPGSGKSYEATVSQIIPALLKGRKVFAYIEGINHEQFALICDKSIDEIKDLLIYVDKDKVLKINEHVENDSLVVIDEIQDFFPNNKKQLSQGITEFVTQHRHRGIDIVIMGQSHKDTSVLWRRRIDTLITFFKRDAVGFKKSYTWTTFKQQGDRFIKIRSGSGKYDEKYFGLYASHAGGVTAIDSHDDDRANALKSWVYQFGFPAFFVLVCWALYYLWGIFHHGLGGSESVINKPVKVVEHKTSVSSPASVPVQQTPTPVSTPVSTPMPKVEQKTPSEPSQRELNHYKDFIDYYFFTYRPKLSAFIQSETDGRLLYARIEFYTPDNLLKDSFDIAQLKEFGYEIRVASSGLVVKKNGEEFLVKAWKKETDTRLKRYSRDDDREEYRSRDVRRSYDYSNNNQEFDYPVRAVNITRRDVEQSKCVIKPVMSDEDIAACR